MTQLRQLEMPDGTVIWARIEPEDEAAPPDSAAPQGKGTDVALRDLLGRKPQAAATEQAAQAAPPPRLDKLSATIRSVASAVHDGVVRLEPDAVSVEFGIELSTQTGAVISVLASGGMRTSIRVRLSWDLSKTRLDTDEDDDEPDHEPDVAEPEPEPAGSPDAGEPRVEG